MEQAGVEETILVVDDNPTNLQLLVDSLSDRGFTVLVAQDGQRAMHIADLQPPELILLDVMMPGIDGFETCRRLKARPTLKDVPVIFMTALGEPADKVRGFHAGAVDYLTKPIQQEELFARVDAHIGLARSRRQLRLYSEQLEQRNRELDAFARTVAHDLKNPLNSVMVFTHLLEHGKEYGISEAERNDAAVMIARAGQKMLEIIDALLMLAGVSSQAPPALETVQMDSLIRRVLGERLVALRQDHPGEVEIGEELPAALGYAPWVEEIWANYLSNGFKYGGNPARLRVGGEAQGPLVRFWVEDDGPGLEDSVRDRLFLPFSRLHESRSGHGLGLSIVRQITDKLRGECGVETAPGGGCRFYFCLPRVAG